MTALPAEAQDLLRDLERFGHDNDARETDRSRKLLNLERETAELMQVMIRSGKRRRILEIGTSNGYSTIWLAAALPPDAPALISLERDAAKTEQARVNLRRAGLAGRVRLLVGDATALTADLPGPFDCVFFDADRISAPDQLRLLLPKLTPDALLLADNALSHPDEIAGYIAAVTALPDFTVLTVPVGKGLHIAYRG